MKCSNCGASLSGNETFCPRCMTRLPARPPDDTPEASAPRPKRQRLRLQPVLKRQVLARALDGAPDAHAPRPKRRRVKLQPILVGLVTIVALGLVVGVGMNLASAQAPDPLRDARRLYALHRDADAVAALEDAVTQEPGAGDTHLLLGRALLRLEMYDEAAEAFAYAIHDSDLPSAYLGLGQAAFHLGRDELAEDNLREAVARMPRSSAAHATLGALYFQQGRLDDAQVHLKETMQLDPDDAWAQAYLGRTYLQLGNPAAAIPELKQALKGNPKDVAPYLALAQAYAATGQHGQAATSFLQVLRRQPGNLKALTGYSTALLALNEEKTARAALERALDEAELAQQAQQAAVVAGWLEYANEQYAKAQDWFAAALTFDPRSAAAHNGLGWVALRMDDCNAANAAFEAALALQPKGWNGAQTPQAGLEACQ
jgi:tetratricopeptide (TPR) repeat protein